MTNLDIVKKLIGEIRPVAESSADNERFENLKSMCELSKQLLTEIDNACCSYPFNKEFSIRRNCDYGIKFLNEIGFRGSAKR